MRRRIIREKVVQALYAHEISGDPLDHVITCVLEGLKNNRAAHEFARNLVIETVHHSADIDKIIKARVANWDFKRIAILDRLILRMGICELLYFREIPPKVTMNEAIELAKLNKKVYDQFPDSGRVGDAVAKMADYYYDQKDYARATEVFENVLANQPDAKFLDVILFNYGRCLFRMDRKPQALAKFEQLLSEFPDSPLAADTTKIIDAMRKTEK